MSLFKQLVCRGNAVIREWHTNDDIDGSSKRMIAELTATTLANLSATQERMDEANALRIALTTAFQIGRNTRRAEKRRKRRKA